MAIQVFCPSGHRLNVPDSKAGQRVRCLRCREMVYVPEPSERERTGDDSDSGTDQAGDAIWDKLVDELSAAEQEEASKSSDDADPGFVVLDEGPQESPGPSQSKPKPPEGKPPPLRAKGKPPKPVAAAAKPPPLPVKRKPAASKPAPREPALEAPQSGRPEPRRPPPEPPVETKSEPKGEAGSKPTGEAATESEPDRSEMPSARRKRRRDRKRPKRTDQQSPAPTTPEAANGPPESTPQGPKRGLRRRPKSPRQPKLTPADVYRPDEGHVVTVKWLALILSLAVLFSLTPVLMNIKTRLNLGEADGWARAVVLLAVLQAVYIAWMVNRPDWAGVWVVMVVFAAVATIYGMATAMALAWPVHEPMLLGMERVRQSAKGWCGSVLLVMSLATYLCGRTSAKWRRTLELEKAGTGSTRR